MSSVNPFQYIHMSPLSFYRAETKIWSVERVVFLIAGIFAVTFTLLGIFIHPGFHWATLFVGGMLMFFAITGYCPMAMLIHAILKRENFPSN